MNRIVFWPKLAGILFVLFWCQYVGATEDTVSLFRESAAMTTAIQISRDYQHGFTVEPDQVKAMAWMKIYVDMLPKTYPQKAQLLAPWSKGLTKEQRQQVFALAHDYKVKYQLVESMSEEHLASLFINKSLIDTKLKDNKRYLPTAVSFFEVASSLQQSDYVAFKALYRDHEQRPAEVLVFGRVVLDGEGMPEQVQSEQHCVVSSGGYFMCSVKDNLCFKLNGYKSRSVAIDINNTVQPIGQLVLHKLAPQESATVVGRFEGLANEEDIAVKIRAIDDQNKPTTELWRQKPLLVTVLGNGQFYARGLSFGQYQLMVDYQGRRKLYSFTLSYRGTKSIPSINLN